MKCILPRKLLSNYTTVNTFTFWKVSFKPYNFRAIVYKGVIPPWMEEKLYFHENCCQTILLWKLSISEKLFLNHTTFGFPFIKTLSSHEWNENHTSTKTVDKLQGFLVKPPRGVGFFFANIELRLAKKKPHPQLYFFSISISWKNVEENSRLE